MTVSYYEREEILSSPTAVGQLGGYYSGGQTEIRSIGYATVEGQTVSYVDRTDPYFALSEGFAQKASVSGVSVSQAPTGDVRVTPGAGYPVYAFNEAGESLGRVPGQYVQDPAQSALLVGSGLSGMAPLLLIAALAFIGKKRRG